jgi:hypothetical protein
MGVGTPPDVECWVFDVDGCLVDSLTGTSLRPLARQLLEHLGRTSRVLLWSAGGGAYAKERAEQFRMDSHVSGYFSKEGRDRDGCYGIAHLSVDPGRTVFVDDRPEDLARDLRVITVSPYLSDDPHDRGLEGIAHRGGLPRSPGL